MFTSFSASNYKAWRATDDIALAPITGFFGANSSGKTSLLQLFLLLKQTVQSPDTSKLLDLGGDSNALVSVGGWNNLGFGHANLQSVRFGFCWTPERSRSIHIPETDDFLIPLPSLAFSAGIYLLWQSASLLHLAYASDRFEVELSSERIGAELQLAATLKDGRNFLMPRVGGQSRIPAPIHCYGFPNELLGQYENAEFLRDLQLELEHQFEQRLFYLGPRREGGRRRYAWQGTEPADVGRNGELAVDALLASRDRGRNNAVALAADGAPKERVSVEEHVARMLRDLGLVTEFSVERASESSELYRVKVQLAHSSVPVDLVDVGFGVSQLLPLLVLLAYVPEGSTLLLEQPEMHLHPRVQSQLADVLVDVTRARNLQVIFESHSEHMLMRLQRRVAEQEIAPEGVALYFCENDGKESSISQLQLDKCGSIANWPEDFFGDAMGETAAIVSAGLRHRAETEA